MISGMLIKHCQYNILQ